MIRSFKDKRAQSIWEGRPVKRLSIELQNLARRKLRMLNNAVTLNDLLIPPGNRLEALTGDRKGYYSIRVNQQWRLCFSWQDHDVFDIEIVDYH